MLAKKLRDMHALAADGCDPEFNAVLLEAATEIERLEAETRRLRGEPGFYGKSLKEILKEPGENSA